MAGDTFNQDALKDDSASRSRDKSSDSEQKYRLLFEKSPVGILQFDSNLIITDCNGRFADILRSTKDKLLGLDLHLLKDKSVLCAFNDAIAGNNGFYEGMYHVTTSTAVLYVSLKTTPLFSPNNSNIEGGLAIVEDITDRIVAEQELKKKEHHFRLLATLTTDAASILTFNPDGTFKREWLSDSLLHTVGYVANEIDSFEKWEKIVHPDDIYMYREAIARILKGEKIALDFRIIGKKREICWINNTVYPEYDDSGKLVRLISALKNITAQKEAELGLSYQNVILINLS